MNEILCIISGICGFAALFAGVIINDMEVFQCGLLLHIISAIYAK